MTANRTSAPIRRRFEAVPPCGVWKDPGPDPDTARVSHVNTGWGKTEQMKSSANATARQIRTMDTQVQNMAHTLRRMTTDIRAFRKNFPPFPRGSEERERLLNSFQGIRKQIERLTIPPKKETVPTRPGS